MHPTTSVHGDSSFNSYLLQHFNPAYVYHAFHSIVLGNRSLCVLFLVTIQFKVRVAEQVEITTPSSHSWQTEATWFLPFLPLSLVWICGISKNVLLGLSSWSELLITVGKNVLFHCFSFVLFPFSLERFFHLVCLVPLPVGSLLYHVIALSCLVWGHWLIL